MFFIYWAVSFLILWIFFVNVMWLKENEEKIPKYLKYPAYAFAFVGILWDVVFNIIFGSIMFLQKPDFAGAHFKWKGIGFPTLTERLRDILRGGRGTIFMRRYQYYLARFICRYLVEPWDKAHCGMED